MHAPVVIWRTAIMRLARVVTAYAISCIVVGSVFYFWGWLPTYGYTRRLDFWTIRAMLELYALGFSILAAIPTFILIALAEVKRIRVWQAYGMAGVLIGAFVFVFVYWWTKGGPTSPPHFSMLAGACLAGGLAGLTFWLVAGRTAGSWRRQNVTSPAL